MPAPQPYPTKSDCSVDDWRGAPGYCVPAAMSSGERETLRACRERRTVMTMSKVGRVVVIAAAAAVLAGGAASLLPADQAEARSRDSAQQANPCSGGCP